ncbi:MAG TPA: hypothetical protein VK206_13035 [Anaerolineales bacterium]|nr:hypothetical protein [Anaerolineales bacterium]
MKRDFPMSLNNSNEPGSLDSQSSSQAENQPNNYKDFDIPIPEFLEDWTDTSWYKDVTASSSKDFPNGNNLRVWVYPDDPTEREYEGQLKYLVVLEDEDGNEVAHMGANTDIECIKAIEELEMKNANL